MNECQKVWTISERVGLWSLVVGIIAVVASITIPEIRHAIGLGHTEPGEFGIVTQEGAITFNGMFIYEVHYSRPFNAIPNLEIDDGGEGCVASLDQKQEGFTLHLKSLIGMSPKIKWKAKGRIGM